MQEFTLPSQEVIGVDLIKELNQLQRVSLGTEDPTCQRCGKRLHAGEHVAVYAFRRCPHSAWRAGQTRCVDHPPKLESLASLGVREYVVTGRIGHCLDHTFQREWPVLLAPRLEAVSPSETDAATDLPSLTLNDLTECPIADATLDDLPAYEYVEAPR